ncbi:DUF411 domain-containing protein [Eleftheria terrae]|uniref:DUF411 domain-containing protein n=1 Tax=Eleftheria terrae TaxID=1597781 RepID=UPI00263B7314|nr:DUF411 domain-containing protein [Eleftheria terrae]WKB54747.1 DUF411 domain-containing protein [Eleftheria terrae]
MTLIARRGLLAAFAACAALPVLAATPSRPHIEVWKSESCGCCQGWVEHLQRQGFDVTVRHVEGPADQRRQLGMPDRYGSCHTARVQGYLLEGHVPAREIHRLLKERPDALGLAVPAMPVGSPGMEVGTRKDPYDVLLVTRSGQSSVYQSYR